MHWAKYFSCFFFSSRRRHTRFDCDWSSDVCSSDLPGGLGILDALGGLGLGLAALLPLYLLRAAGAGDAKLMAMVGAFLGPIGALGAVLATFFAGLLLSLLVIARGRLAGAVTRNFQLMALGGFDPARDAAAKLPYSAAIAIGTAAFIAWRSIA